MDDLRAANDKLKQKRREQGISETGRPILATSKSQSNGAKDVIKKWLPENEETTPLPRCIAPLVYVKNGDECYPDTKCDCPTCQSRREDNEKVINEKLSAQRDHPETTLSLWNVPKKHHSSSFESFQGGEAVKGLCIDASKKLESVILCGKTGCGKTHLAVAMMRRKIISHPRLFSVNHPYSEAFARFVTTPELLLEIRATYNNKNGIAEEDVIDKYSNVSFLILDDLGAEKVTEWTEAALYLVIDRRNRDQRWTVVTSNLSLEEIEQHLGARIASRLSDMKVVNIKLPDYRKKR